MEFTGRVKQILPLRSGVSQRTGNEWKALPFVFEYLEYETDRYPDSMYLETFDEKVIGALKEGMEVKCTVSHRTREHEGRIYNEIRLVRIESVRRAQQAGVGTAAVQQFAQPSPQMAAQPVGQMPPYQQPMYGQQQFTPQANQNGQPITQQRYDNLPF